MLLGKYFHNINKNYKNFSFSGISFDTITIKKNNIFFAIKGNSIDGNKFIPQAIKKGSKIIVTERKTNCGFDVGKIEAKVFIFASEYAPPSGWSAVPVFPPIS